jgi:hypothetical protein
LGVSTVISGKRQEMNSPLLRPTPRCNLSGVQFILYKFWGRKVGSVKGRGGNDFPGSPHLPLVLQRQLLLASFRYKYTQVATGKTSILMSRVAARSFRTFSLATLSASSRPSHPVKLLSPLLSNHISNPRPTTTPTRSFPPLTRAFSSHASRSHAHTNMAANADPDCIFCKIIAGDIPSFKLAETNKLLAFLDIQPLSRGHAV